MKVLNRLSLQLAADELKVAIEAWVRLTDSKIADHLRDNPCNISIREGETENSPTIQIDIAGDFIDNPEE